MTEEKDDKIFEAYRGKLLEQYSNKSKQFQRVFTIVVGIGAFFLLMILFPYFSLKSEYNSISQFNPLMNNISEVTIRLNGIINGIKAYKSIFKPFMIPVLDGIKSVE